MPWCKPGEVIRCLALEKSQAVGALQAQVACPCNPVEGGCGERRLVVWKAELCDHINLLA
jgi:hypothetical protein